MPGGKKNVPSSSKHKKRPAPTNDQSSAQKPKRSTRGHQSSSRGDGSSSRAQQSSAQGQSTLRTLLPNPSNQHGVQGSVYDGPTLHVPSADTATMGFIPFDDYYSHVQEPAPDGPWIGYTDTHTQLQNTIQMNESRDPAYDDGTQDRNAIQEHAYRYGHSEAAYATEGGPSDNQPGSPEVKQEEAEDLLPSVEDDWGYVNPQQNPNNYYYSQH